MKTNRLIAILLLPFLAAAFMSLQNNPANPAQKNRSFKPGQLWLDNHGAYINAHGGGILYDKKCYYWYGEHQIQGPAGNKAQVGVHCYASKDLYNWKDEGIALKVAEDDQHDLTKPMFL